jgi:hypothetical protein
MAHSFSAAGWLERLLRTGFRDQLKKSHHCGSFGVRAQADTWRRFEIANIVALC